MGGLNILWGDLITPLETMVCRGVRTPPFINKPRIIGYPLIFRLCFHVVYHRHIFKQLLFCFILLPSVHLLAPKKNKTCDINNTLREKLVLY